MDSIVVLPPNVSLALTGELLVEDSYYPTIQEVYLGDLLPGLPHMNREHIHREWHYWFAGADSRKEAKALPYWDQGSLEHMQQVGFRLWRDTNIQNAIQNLMAYVIYKGWTYSINRVKLPERELYKDDKLELLKRTHRDLLRETSLGIQRGWLFVQTESYLRYLRDGEYFRRWWVVDGGQLHVRFIEVVDICQPDSLENVINLQAVPDEVKRQIARAERLVAPGELGIVTREDDAATELGYWQRLRGRSDQKWQWVDASVCQHAKCNVDANDPRGVPAFYDAVCPAHQATQVTDAMNELAVKQSKYAVVHKHRSGNRAEAIREMAAKRATEWNTQVSENERDPAETHLKNVEIEMHAMQAQARQYVEVIQQDQRTIGGLRAVPEFMVSNDANTGNRSSLLAASSPFGRRVTLDQRQMWYFDEQLQWDAIGAILDWQEATKTSAKRRVMIQVTFPVSDEKDADKESKRLVLLRKDGMISRQHQCRLGDVDYDQMQQELAEEQSADWPVFVSPNEVVRQTQQGNENGRVVLPARPKALAADLTIASTKADDTCDG